MPEWGGMAREGVRAHSTVMEANNAPLNLSRPAAVLRLARLLPPSAGGQQQHVARLATAQTKAGWPNTVVYSEGQVAYIPGCTGCRVGGASWVPSDYAREALFAAAVLRRFKNADSFGVVHSHGTSGDLLATTRIGRLGIRAFHTFHAILAIPKHARFTYKKFLPRLTGIFVVNAVIQAQLEALDCDLPPIYVLPSAIDDVFFSIKPEPNRARVVMVGSLVPMKGFDVGLRAAEILYNRAEISGVDLIGTGVEQRRLRAIAAGLRVPVQFHGRLSKGQLAVLMGRAAVILCPSRTLKKKAEGTPTVIMEAWAAGVPVVACASGGIVSTIRHGIDGFLVAEEDAAGLADRAAEAIRTSELLADAGRKRVRGYTWDHLAKRMIAVYERGNN